MRNNPLSLPSCDVWLQSFKCFCTVHHSAESADIFKSAESRTEMSINSSKVTILFISISIVTSTIIAWWTHLQKFQQFTTNLYKIPTLHAYLTRNSELSISKSMRFLSIFLKPTNLIEMSDFRKFQKKSLIPKLRLLTKIRDHIPTNLIEMSDFRKFQKSRSFQSFDYWRKFVIIHPRIWSKWVIFESSKTVTHSKKVTHSKASIIDENSWSYTHEFDRNEWFLKVPRNSLIQSFDYWRKFVIIIIPTNLVEMSDVGPRICVGILSKRLMGIFATDVTFKGIWGGAE